MWTSLISWSAWEDTASCRGAELRCPLRIRTPITTATKRMTLRAIPVAARSICNFGTTVTHSHWPGKQERPPAPHLEAYLDGGQHFRDRSRNSTASLTAPRPPADRDTHPEARRTSGTASA